MTIVVGMFSGPYHVRAEKRYMLPSMSICIGATASSKALLCGIPRPFIFKKTIFCRLPDKSNLATKLKLQSTGGTVSSVGVPRKSLILINVSKNQSQSLCSAVGIQHMPVK